MTLTNTAYHCLYCWQLWLSVVVLGRAPSLLTSSRNRLFSLRSQASQLQTSSAAGFYYTGGGYIIKCYCCKLHKRRTGSLAVSAARGVYDQRHCCKLTFTCLNNCDDPFSVYQFRAPNCPFLLNILVIIGGLCSSNMAKQYQEWDRHC